MTHSLRPSHRSGWRWLPLQFYRTRQHAARPTCCSRAGSGGLSKNWNGPPPRFHRNVPYIGHEHFVPRVAGNSGSLRPGERRSHRRLQSKPIAQRFVDRFRQTHPAQWTALDRWLERETGDRVDDLVGWRLQERGGDMRAVYYDLLQLAQRVRGGMQQTPSPA